MSVVGILAHGLASNIGRSGATTEELFVGAAAHKTHAALYRRRVSAGHILEYGKIVVRKNGRLHVQEPINSDGGANTSCDYSFCSTIGFIAPCKIVGVQELSFGNHPLPHDVFEAIGEGLLSSVGYLLGAHYPLDG